MSSKTLTPTEQAKLASKQLRQFILPSTSVIEDAADIIDALVADIDFATEIYNTADKIAKDSLAELNGKYGKKYYEELSYKLRAERDAETIIVIAQRKILEQAKEALQAALSDDQPYIKECENAITAIQELK